MSLDTLGLMVSINTHPVHTIRLLDMPIRATHITVHRLLLPQSQATPDKVRNKAIDRVSAEALNVHRVRGAHRAPGLDVLDGLELLGGQVGVVPGAVVDGFLHGRHGLAAILVVLDGLEGEGAELERLVELLLRELVVGRVGGALDDCAV